MPHPSPIHRLWFACAALLAAAPLSAQTFFDWDGGAGSTSWLQAANWNPDASAGTLFTTADTAIRFDGTPAATPASTEIPPIVNPAINQLIYSGAFNATQTSTLVLGSNLATSLTFSGVNPRFVVADGQVSTTHLAGSELRLNANTEFAIDGVLQVNGGIVNASLTRMLTKTGAGTLVLRGSNSFGGSGVPLRLEAGTLDVVNDAQLGSSISTLLFANIAAQPAWLRVDAGGGNRVLGHAMSVVGSGSYGFDIRNTDGEGVAIADALDQGSAPGAPQLRKVGNGTLRLMAANTLSRLVLEDGRVRTPAAGALSVLPSVVVEFPAGSDAVLSLDGQSAAVANLIATDGSAGSIENGAATPAMLTIASAADAGFGGTLRDGAAGTLALSVTGSAPSGLELSGDNSFSGDVDVHARLRIDHEHALGSTLGETILHGDGMLRTPFRWVTPFALAEPLVMNGGTLSIAPGFPPLLQGPILFQSDGSIESSGGGCTLQGALQLNARLLSLHGLRLDFDPASTSYNSGARIELASTLMRVTDSAKLFDADAAPALSIGPASSLQLGGAAATTLPNALLLSGMGFDANQPTLQALDDHGNGATRVLNGPITLQSSASFGGDAGLVVNAPIAGGGDLFKRSGNRLVLNAVNTYSGDTFVEDGELQVNGSLADNAVILVDGPGCCVTRSMLGSASGVLSGAGSVGHIELFGGAIAPGSGGVGSLMAESLHASFAGGSLRMQLGADAGDPAASDLLQLGALDIAPNVVLGVVFGDGIGTPQDGAVYTLIETATAHGLDPGSFAIAGYSGALPDFGGRFQVSADRVQFVVDQGYLFADEFD
jgi:autotransporter-associated beta strand protein